MHLKAFEMRVSLFHGLQAHSQVFQKGGYMNVCMYDVCISKQDLGGLGACSRMKMFEIRCSEIASEPILG